MAWKSPPRCSITSRVFRPIEPVEPRIAMRLGTTAKIANARAGSTVLPLHPYPGAGVSPLVQAAAYRRTALAAPPVIRDGPAPRASDRGQESPARPPAPAATAPAPASVRPS